MCRFHVPAPGASSPAYVAYITRPDAVLDRGEGIRLLNFPPETTHSYNYASERCALIAWATTREAMERMNTRHCRGRTHYRAVLSFEDAVETPNALRLAAAWVNGAFPRASALLVLHRDTDHPHVHVWLDARQTDGRKIDLSARQYRQLDERWARLYCRERGQDEREYLRKKWQTERKKQVVREQLARDRIAREHKVHIVKEGIAHETAQEQKKREGMGRDSMERDSRGPGKDASRDRNERAGDASPGASPVGRGGQLFEQRGHREFDKGCDRAAALAAPTIIPIAPAARLAPPEQKPPERINFPDQRDEFDALVWER